MNKNTTLYDGINAFIENIKKSRPANTYNNYKSNLLGDLGFLSSLNPTVKPTSPIENLSDRHGVVYIQSLLDRNTSAATRARAASCLRSFFKFAAYNYDLPLNIGRFTYALESMQLLAGPKDIIDYPGEKIQRVLDYTITMRASTLQDKRDLAFIWVIAETGLRVSEACAVKIGDIDRKHQISVVGKGAKPAVVTIGKKSRGFIVQYLNMRSALDKETGIPRSNLPLFARHDQTSGKNKIKPINPKKAQSIIHNIAMLALGDEYEEIITCHKFRHYFVTKVYQHRGDIKAAQQLARHEDIRTTQRYTHRDSEDNAKLSKEIFG